MSPSSPEPTAGASAPLGVGPSSWPSPLLLDEPGQAVSVDLTRAGVSPEALTSLPWSGVFDAMAALESGAIANPDEGRQVGHYWLRAPERAPTLALANAIGDAVEATRKLVDGVRGGTITAPDGAPFTDVVHIGIGGSALGPALVVDALGTADGLPIHFLDNTDPEGVARVLARIGARLRHTLVVVVSKSGSTPEPMNGLALVLRACRARGLAEGARCVAITVAGSKLDKRAAEEGWLAVLPLWDWVGGRTSIMGTVGLLPAGFAGVDLGEFLAGAAQMDEWTRLADPMRNPAALVAGAWFRIGGGKGERAGVILPYADRLILLSRYLQQLVMESLGKRLDVDGNVVEQGLVIYGNKGSTDQHAYVQQLRDGRNDFFATFVQVLDRGAEADLEVAPGVRVGDYLQGFLIGTRRALAEAGRPSITLTVPTVSPRVLGALIALFERAVGFYASLIRVNAYHQPGVEAGKKAAADVLDLSRRLQETLATGPVDLSALAAVLSADPVEVHYLVQHLAATGRAQRDGDVWRCT